MFHLQSLEKKYLKVRVDSFTFGWLFYPRPSNKIKIQAMGGKVKKSWVQIPTLEGKKSVAFAFSFHFKIFHFQSLIDTD